MATMKGINAYYRQLSSAEIEEKAHREFVGGLWNELGRLQFDFLLEAGLKPNHNLLDIGCGCLRGGLYYIAYLNEGNYFGLDINQSLVDAGKIELEEAGLSHKKPNLLIDDSFSLQRFGKKFDYIVSISVFTHLPFNNIIRCLSNVKECLLPNGVYYSTYFQAPESSHLEPITQRPGGVVTKYDSDPYHYSIEELAYMAGLANLDVTVLGDWGHPRNQKIAVFSLKKSKSS